MSDSIVPSTTVYTASFAALLGALTIGLALGYSGPAFYEIERSNSTFIFDEKNKDEVSGLIGSMLAVGAIPGSLLVAPANRFFGRRLSLVFFGLPFAIGWLFLGLAKNVTMMIIGRLLTGLCCGTISGIAPTYVVEISPPQIRGTLGTCFQVMVVIGILFEAIFCFGLSWQALGAVNIVFALGMSVVMFFMPETPQWLLAQGRNEEAEQSLRRLRKGDIVHELNVLQQASADINSQQDGTSGIAIIKTIQFYKPFLFAMFLMFFQQFSGINAVLFYSNNLFEGKKDFDPRYGTLAIGIAQVIATVIGSALVDRSGRRYLLLASGIGHTVSLIAFGSLSKDNIVGSVICIVIYISSFSIGYGPIPWMMIPELSSTKVRSIIATIATLFNWVCVCIVTGCVKPLQNLIGTGPTYYSFALICALSCIFVIFFLPETKGKTSEQIQRELLGIPERTLQVASNPRNTSSSPGHKNQEGQDLQPFATA